MTGACPFVSVVAPTTNGVGDVVLVPSLTDTFSLPLSPFGTRKLTVAFPLALAEMVVGVPLDETVVALVEPTFTVSA